MFAKEPEFDLHWLCTYCTELTVILCSGIRLNPTCICIWPQGGFLHARFQSLHCHYNYYYWGHKNNCDMFDSLVAVYSYTAIMCNCYFDILVFSRQEIILFKRSWIPSNLLNSHEDCIHMSVYSQAEFRVQGSIKVAWLLTTQQEVNSLMC